MKYKKNLLVTLADKNYIEQAKQLFSSVYWNAGWKGDYMLLAHEIPEKKLGWFRDKGILIKKCKPLLDLKSLSKERWPPTILNKLYLFTPEFKKWKVIIFLDADIIVRASLEELTKIKGFVAVKGHDKLSKLFLSPLHIKLKKVNKKIYKELKRDYNLDVPSFNVGMITFDTPIIKKNTFYELNRLLNKYLEISDAKEEAILNLYFYKKWIKLPETYNLNPFYLTKLYNIKPKQINGIVLHFHEHKPWNSKNYFYKEWKNNLKKAGLINLKKPKPSLKKRTKEDIKKYLQSLQKRRILYYCKYLFWKINLNTKRFIDKNIGLFGVLLKSNFPSLYLKLKNQKKNERV